MTPRNEGDLGKPMKVIWITRSDLRHMTNGANLYSRGLIDGLRSCGVDVEVYGYCGSEESPVDGSSLHLFPQPHHRRVLSLLSSLQSDAYRLRSADLAEALSRDIDAGTDAVVFDYFAMGWALPTVRRRAAKDSGCPTALVYVSHNHESTVRRQVAREYRGNPLMKAVLHLDAWKAERLEQELVGSADLVTAITGADASLFKADAPERSVLTLLPAYDGPVDAEWKLAPQTPRRVVMMGSLEWIAKRESLRRFVEAANDPFRSAGIELVVVGKVDPSFEQSIRSKWSVCRFLGFLEDPTPILRDSRIGLMADELGGGFKLKYLDYIFRGLPVATIRSHAVGLPFSPDDVMLTGETVTELVESIIESIDDLDRLNAMKSAAFEACTGKFDWASRGVALRDAIIQASGRF